MKTLIIATSMNPESKSQLLAQKFEKIIKNKNIPCDRVDLRETNLPFAGTNEGWSSKEASNLKEKVENSSHIVFAVPIYCYDVNSAAKNVIELIGRSFTKKIISFICSAGGSSSYMSVMGMANHLMLDFRSIIVPRFLYVETSDWKNDTTLNPKIEERLNLLLDDMQEIKIISE